jgi:hypothetical protein
MIVTTISKMRSCFTACENEWGSANSANRAIDFAKLRGLFVRAQKREASGL